MSISVGDTFLYEAPANKRHLHIVVEKIIDSDTCICAFVSSIVSGRGYDRACVLDSGDCTFIQHPYYVVYDKLRFFDMHQLEEMISNGIAIKKDHLSDAVIERIRNGAIASKMTHNNFRKYFIKDSKNPENAS